MKQSEQTETGASALAHAAADAATPEASATTEPRKILLVEDDHAIRRYLEVILQKAGYAVITASDGLEAMKVALTTPVDAVVTDAIMPHLTGQELCRFLRHQTKLARLPVILLSGLENRAAAATAKEDGADIYLTKPVSPQHLIKCLEQLL